MDSLQQKFGGEPEIITRHPYRKIIVFIAIGSMVASTLWGYVLWQKNQVIPTVSIAPEVVLTDAEVETYRTALPRTYETGESLTADNAETPFFTPSETPVVEIADTEVVTKTASESFVSPENATRISVADSSLTFVEGATTGDIQNSEAYIEGDTTVADMIITQPDRVDIAAFSGTGVVVATDGNLRRLVVTSNGQVITIDMNGATLTTTDGKSLPLTSLQTNDIVSVTGQKLLTSPVIIEAHLQLVGVLEFIQVMDMGV